MIRANLINIAEIWCPPSLTTNRHYMSSLLQASPVNVENRVLIEEASGGQTYTTLSVSSETDSDSGGKGARQTHKSQATGSRCTSPLLHIVRQPEEKHRARYLSEGSRGAVKDMSRTSYTTIQLIGYSRPTTVQVYAGVDDDSGRPHPSYRVIKVGRLTGFGRV